MKFLDALVSERPTTAATRSSFQDYVDSIVFGSQSYLSGLQTSYGIDKADPVANTFLGYVTAGHKGNATIAAVERVRIAVFCEARFQWRRIRAGRPGDLFGDQSLSIFERPWAGGVTGDLLGRMILDADYAGNSFHVIINGEIVRLRPDWVDILLAPRISLRHDHPIGYERVGYVYWHDGKASKQWTLFTPDEVSHFAPNPDPLADYAGMSWLTPIIREIQADTQATKHKLKFFENAATPNLAVSLPKEITPKQFGEFVDEMDRKHKGAANAYKTLYTAGGADVTVIGANLEQINLKATQGAGETRIAAAGGIHPVVAALSEGMQGAGLNVGNFAAARRLVADATFRPLWRNAAGSLENLANPPADAMLWYDERDIGFLREDRKDQAEIQGLESRTIRTLLDAGYEGESVQAAVLNQDWSLLKHSGLFSVQLQAPGSSNPTTPTTEE